MRPEGGAVGGGLSLQGQPRLHAPDVHAVLPLELPPELVGLAEEDAGVEGEEVEWASGPSR